MILINHNEMRCGRYYCYFCMDSNKKNELGIVKVHRIVREYSQPYYISFLMISARNKVNRVFDYNNPINISFKDGCKVYDLTDDEIMNHILIDSI